MFNIVCELPETVARSLVPRMRVVKGTGKAINYLTPPRILLALITAWLRQGRWFDEQVLYIGTIMIFSFAPLHFDLFRLFCFHFARLGVLTAKSIGCFYTKTVLKFELMSGSSMGV